MKKYSLIISAALHIVVLFHDCSAFVRQTPRGLGLRGGFGDCGGGMGPPKSYDSDYTGSNDESSSFHSFRGLWQQRRNETDIDLLNSDNCESRILTSSNGNNNKNRTVVHCFSMAGEPGSRLDFRGGGDIVKGTKATLSTTASWWKNAWKSTTQSVSNSVKGTGKKISSTFQSKEKKKEDELLAQLQTLPVRIVTIPNTTVLPSDVIQLAAKRAGVIGNPLRTDRVQNFASLLKQWYARRGYVLHSVTGATLLPDTATAEISVQEPKVSQYPVDITFCKEMVIDEESGKLLTFRQYKERHSARKTLGHEKITKQDTNRTFVETTGRTSSSKIATVLGLSPGSPFCWDDRKWQKITSSGIFSRILRTGPARMNDGTVQLSIVATEAPARHLEYGVTKSLYTGSWEGEIDFQHGNLLGGGETLGLAVRRGAKDAEPTVRIKYSDDKFGMAGGYDAEVFSDFIGDNKAQHNKAQLEDDNDNSNETRDYDSDDLLTRKGISFRFRNPIDEKVIQYSSASACLERTSTQTGLHEMVGSGTVVVGPFVKELPYDARSNIDVSVTAGTRIPEVVSNDGSSRIGFRPLPYSSTCVTTKQVLPLTALSSLGSEGRPLVLALRHAITTSSRHLPRHEGNALGIAATVRGGQPQGRIKTSVVGTTELRVPVHLPTGKTRQDANVVVFCDWVWARKSSDLNMINQSSVGIGLRKSVQGIPLKVDVSYSKEGKVKSVFGLGHDFSV